MSLRARLLAASLALLIVGLLIADVATFQALRSFLYDRVDGQLEGARQSLLESLQKGASVEAAVANLGAAAPGVFVQVRNPADFPIYEQADRAPGVTASGPKLPKPLSPLVPFQSRSLQSEPATRYMSVPGMRDNGPRYRVQVSPAANGYSLVVALPLQETAATLQRLVAIEVLVTLGVIAVAAGLGLWLVRLGLRPLGDIEATAAAITSGDLSQRVPRQDDRTEVGRLGGALNTMLDAIDVAFEERRTSEEAARAAEQRVRQFVADASHELRTPVAAIRAYAELYRMGADERPQDLARLLARIEEEAERTGVLVDDLLLLTRLDEGRPLEQLPVDLGAVATDAVTTARALEPDRPISLDVVGSVEVLGDRNRLRQVVDNLLANVRAHTPPGSPADISVAPADRSAVLEVADRGPGLNGEQLEDVFQRFYRADASRSRDQGGSGLGLSIVTAIAAAHRGEATAAAREGGGMVFRVRLPLLDAN
jgi:two-component system OmpR family sensor kinase